jgi:electron transport complex protein RnfE
LFANASLLLGSAFRFMEITLIPHYKGFLLMALPPGGFIMLGFIIAGKRWLDIKRAAVKKAQLDVAPVVEAIEPATQSG